MDIKTAQKIFSDALDQINSMNWSVAEDMLVSLEQAFPERESIKINLLMVRLKTGDLTSCEQIVTTLSNSTNSVALLNCGKFYETTDKFDLALRFYESAMSIDPENTEIINSVSVTCARLGKYQRAAELSHQIFRKTDDLYYEKRAAYFFASCCDWENEKKCWDLSRSAAYPFFDIARMETPSEHKESAQNFGYSEYVKPPNIKSFWARKSVSVLLEVNFSNTRQLNWR